MGTDEPVAEDGQGDLASGQCEQPPGSAAKGNHARGGAAVDHGAGELADAAGWRGAGRTSAAGNAARRAGWRAGWRGRTGRVGADNSATGRSTATLKM